MWLHALQSKAVESPTLAVDLALFCDDGAFNLAPRPESMSHRSPWGIRVCAVVARSVLSSHEARCGPGKLQVDKTVLVGHRLDGVEGAVFGELERHAVCKEGILLFVEAVVLEGVGRPYGGLLVVRVEYFAVELARNPQAPRRNEYLASGPLADEHASYATLLYMTWTKPEWPVSVKK